MLNERIEFEQYTYPLDAEVAAVRLKHKQICNHLSGITRAMTIIARKSLSEGNLSTLERVEQTKNDLRVWCGDLKGNPEETSSQIAFGWLPDYIARILGKEKSEAFERYLNEEPGLDLCPRYPEICSIFQEVQENFGIDAFRTAQSRERMQDRMKMLEMYCGELGTTKEQKNNSIKRFRPVSKILGTLDELNSRFKQDAFNKALFDRRLRKDDHNDYKKIMYDKIIADAITEGPLKRYYLVCSYQGLSQVTFQTGKKISCPFRRAEHKWSEPTKRKADLLMKTIAAVLLEQRARKADHPYKGFVPVNRTNIANWLASSSGTDSLSKYYIDNRFFLKTESFDNVSAFEIDSEWMTSCGWMVVAEEELDQYLKEHPNAEFYSDYGAGTYLRKNERYV